MEVHNSEYKGPLQSERFVHVAIPSEPIWIRNKSRDFAIEQCVGKIHIDSVNTEGNDLILFANINCSYIPFRTDNVTKIYQGILFDGMVVCPDL